MVHVSAPLPPIEPAMLPRGWNSSGLVLADRSGAAGQVPLVPPCAYMRCGTTMR